MCGLKDLFEQGDLEKRLFKLITDLESDGDRGRELAENVRRQYEYSKEQHYERVRAIIKVNERKYNS